MFVYMRTNILLFFDQYRSVIEIALHTIRQWFTLSILVIPLLEIWVSYIYSVISKNCRVNFWKILQRCFLQVDYYNLVMTYLLQNTKNVTRRIVSVHSHWRHLLLILCCGRTYSVFITREFQELQKYIIERYTSWHR